MAVDGLVRPEEGAPPESFGTVLILVWFLSRMDPVMLTEVCPLAEGPRTRPVFLGPLPHLDSLGAEGSPTLRTSRACPLWEAGQRFHWGGHLCRPL